MKQAPKPSTSNLPNAVTATAHEIMLAAGLTKTEQAIFICLASKIDGLVSRSELLALLKGRAPHTIDSHIMEIRRKLAKHGSVAKIETAVGAGFVLRCAKAV